MALSMLFSALFLAWTAAEILLQLFMHTRPGKGHLQDRGSLLILLPVIFASIAMSSRIADTHPPNLFGGANWLGPLSLALVIAGLAVRCTAILTLGRSFSVNVAIHATQKVHKTGLFRFVRHPSYSGLVLIFAAIGLHTRNAEALAIMLIPTTAALLYRIHVEEAVLRSAFGQEYEDYCGSTKRLIPGIY